jgi:hypothetical protein
MRNVVEKIYDEIGDINTTMAQMGKVSERMTMFKLKTQNEVVEKVTPNVNINLTEVVDPGTISDRINSHRDLIEKSKR